MLTNVACGNAMGYDAFISYAHADKASAEAVCARLETAKIRCWIAPRDILPGADWAGAIIGALGTCKVMILIFSSHSNDSPQVSREVKRAFEKGVTVIPFRIEDVNPSESLEYYMGSVHWLDALTKPMEQHIDRLVPLIEAVLGLGDAKTIKGGERPAAPPRTAPPRRALPKAAWIAGAIVLLAAVTAAIVWHLGQQPTIPAPQPAPVVVAGTPAPAPVQTPTATPVPTPVIASTATKENPFVNSLGMKFVPVPGTTVLFSIWDTRVKDFGQFAEATGFVQSGGGVGWGGGQLPGGIYMMLPQAAPYATWANPGFNQTEDNPVIDVNWDEANAFCRWLTEMDQKAGKLGPNQSNRLPTDAEWSAAAGSATYPWGDQWPPPTGVGNYGDEALVESISMPVPHLNTNDGYARTAPVGSFPANQAGLYDLGGNVWNWCRDWYHASMNTEAFLDKYFVFKNDGGGYLARVARGSCWADGDPLLLASGARAGTIPTIRSSNLGFRCVLATGSGQ